MTGLNGYQEAADSPLAIYAAMKDISTKMVDAAKASDWENLTKLEQGVASMRDSLMSKSERASLSAEDRKARMALIQGILANDREIRRYTEPWMEELKQYLGASANEARVRAAYGTPPRTER